MVFSPGRYSVRRLLILIVLFPVTALAQGYRVAAEPDWVTPISIPSSNPALHQQHSNGVEYFLADFQTRVQDQQVSRYRHVVSKALNTSGVEEIAQVSIDFDPIFESLTLHKIVVHRDGKEMDMMGRSQMRLIEREKDLEYQIYDGSKTLNIIIEDVRSGDSVEYSYTVEGQNPIFSGHYAHYIEMQYAVPVARIFNRLLWPTHRKLYIRNHASDIQPVRKDQGKLTEYIWARDNAPAILRDKNTPAWYDPFAGVYLSDMQSWKDVVDWALPLYKPAENTKIQDALIASLKKRATSPETRLLAALHFVQDEVRYLGIEMGERSHKPNMPDAVLKQRFGDCKDKARLLVSLLHGLGIEAYSALVHADNRRQILDRLPTPTAFNHVIVLARLKGKNYWFDPTRSYQAGDLDHLYQPDYEYALVISKKSSGLTPMSPDIPGPHIKSVEETFDIRDSVLLPAHYTVVSRFKGYFAESMRRDLSETNREKVQQSYLNFVAQSYPKTEIAEPIVIEDDKMANQLTTTERYRINDIWVPSDDKRTLYIDFEPFLIDDNLKGVSAVIRSMPYAVKHPVRYHHTTHVLLPKNSRFEDEDVTVKDPAFRFTRKVRFAHDELVIDYEYESLRDHVGPEDIVTYAGNIKKARNLAIYEIQMTNPKMKMSEQSPGEPDWLMFGSSVMSVLGL
jgi:transglutaminase-like putative cysteine protease